MASQVVQEALQGIVETHGELTRDAVVAAARDPRSDLHAQFEWDDAVAGHAYRLDQAGRLIRSIKVVYGMDPQGRDKTVRAYSAARSEQAPHSMVYQPTEEIVVDPLRYRILLRECERAWRRFEAKYGCLQEFHDIVTGEHQQAG